MTWVVWRQHRTQLAVLGAILAAFAVLLAITGTRMADEYQALRRCTDCTGGGFMQSYDLSRTIVNLTVGVPLLLGVFLGAALMGREMEQSTHVLAWTQSVTRRRWLTSKVVTVLAITVLVAGAMSALVTWWSGPLNSLQQYRFEGLQFDVQNLSPVAYSVFAVALGFASGAVLRRTLPAVAVTVGGFFVVRLFVELSLRPHFRAPLHASLGMFKSSPRTGGAWMFGSDLVDAGGHAVSNPFRLPATCAAAVDRAGVDECMTKLGYRFMTTFHPADRYWPFQWTEAAIFVGLAVLLVAVGVVAVLRRDA